MNQPAVVEGALPKSNGPSAAISSPPSLPSQPAEPSGAHLGLVPEYWQKSGAYDPLWPQESVHTRYERGRTIRTQVPRASHGTWTLATGRQDPVAILIAGNQGRQENLVPLRIGRMAASPFAFLRGAAAVMAWDLSRTPSSGLPVIMDGDAHINNFGLYGTPQRDVVIDLNDFDEATFGPWEWDLKRLVASINVAGRENGLDRRERRSAVLRCFDGYSRNMHRLMEMGVLQAWSLFAYADLSRHEEELKRNNIEIGRKSRAVINKVLEKARGTTHQTLLSRIARRQADGAWRFVDDPPILTILDGQDREKVIASLVEYAESIPAEYRFMLQRYSVADVAHRVVGVGSVGNRAYLVMLFGGDEQDPLFLQVKEAVTPAHAPYLPPLNMRMPHEGRRVIALQRALQSLGDPLLGYTTIDGRHYYVRQMKNFKASMPLEWLTGEPFYFWSWVCGLLLARAHARTGDAAKIAGYCGKSDALGRALDDFAEAYGDQTEADHAALVKAIESGQVIAVKDV